MFLRSSQTESCSFELSRLGGSGGDDLIPIPHDPHGTANSIRLIESGGSVISRVSPTISVRTFSSSENAFDSPRLSNANARRTHVTSASASLIRIRSGYRFDTVADHNTVDSCRTNIAVFKHTSQDLVRGAVVGQRMRSGFRVINHHAIGCVQLKVIRERVNLSGQLEFNPNTIG